MRWATLISFSLFTRHHRPSRAPPPPPPTTTPQRSYSSISRDLSLSDQLLSLLHTLPPSSLFPSLDLLSPHLSPHSISSALSSSSSPPAASFRLFLWSSTRRRLRSWLSLNLSVSSLLDSPHSLLSSWDSLADLKRSGRPVPPLAFVALIRAYSALGDTEKALAAFARMPEFDCRPDTFTFNTVLDLLVKKDVVFLAVAIYYQMLKLGCRPNRATFGILIDGLSKAGLIEDAEKLLVEMEHSGIAPTAMIYTSIFSACFGKNEIDEARKLFASMRRNNCRPDAVAFNAMLSGYCRIGRVGEAFERLREFRAEGFVLGLNGYSSLIDGLFRARRFKEACRLYEEMLQENVRPDCILYTIMIRGYTEAGRVDEAFEFLAEMTERGVVPDTYCYNTLIKGLCDDGRLDQARSLRLEISQHDLFPDSTTYTILICALCKEGLVLEAQQIFEEMRKVGCNPTVITFNALISGLCKARKLEEANSLFDKMRIKPSLFLRLSQGVERIRDPNSLRKMVEQLCEAGHVVRAYKLLRDVMDVVPDIVTYNTLINGLFRVGRPDEAVKLFEELRIMRQPSVDEVTLGTVIDGLLKANREEDARTLYQQILKSGRCWSPSICNSLMRSLCQKKRVSQAVSLWLAHVTEWSTSPEDKETINVMKNHFEQGNLEEAVRGLIEMERKGGSINSFPYTIWLIGFCQARKVDEALKIFTILAEFDIEVTPPSCAFLIQSLCWEEKLASALDVMFYALRKGFILSQPVGNRLLKRLCMANKKREAHELVWKMSLAGYDMDMYLRATTKQLLYNQMTGVS